ncbi:MAG: metal-dependent hydrolase [Pseudomonadota bacterium]
MMTAHLPAGYLAVTALDHGFDRDPLVWWAIVVGAVLPDLDMIWFYAVDGVAVHHHTYITHDPSLWLGVLVLGLIASSRALIGVGLGAVSHMALDTITGVIAWGYGRVSFTGPLVEVPARFEPWPLNFLLHWTFALELALWVWAARVWWGARA